tara:strand:- start:12021 stop:12185 length:165 start_codon:yes stop_codon:yes gene_type:complete
MVNEDATKDRPIEHIIIALAAMIQLRESKMDLEELIFLKEAVEKELENYERILH